MKEPNLSLPQLGDRVEILNVPEDHPYRDLYQGTCTVGAMPWEDTMPGSDAVFQSCKDEHKGKWAVMFSNGHNPFFDGQHFELSGSCHYCLLADLKFVKRGPAVFWKWKDRPRANGGENYEMEVSHWTVNFDQLI